MRTKRIIFGATFLLLSGCSFRSPSPEIVIVPPPVAVVHTAPVAAPVPTPAPAGASISSLTAPQLLTAAEQARADAQNYVAWKLSKAENIARLTTLVQGVNLRISQMKDGRIKGRYQPTDIIAAKGAVQALRSFLIVKGD
jgi:hypothetical protein